MFGKIICAIGFFFVFVVSAIIFFIKEKEEPETKENDDILTRLTKEASVMLSSVLKNAGSITENSDTEVCTAIESALRECSSGNEGARDIVKSVIYDWLVNKKNISDAILEEIFEDEKNIRIRFEAVLFMSEKECAGTGFKKLWESRFKDVALCVGELDKCYINDAYVNVRNKITKDDGCRILASVLYADSVGLGTIDLLMWQKKCIEEIQIGMSGVVNGNARNKIMGSIYGENEDEKKYSYESVYIMISGIPIRMDFLAMKNEDELIRIVRNLIKNVGAGELTRKSPRIVCETKDGRRITVTRPPFSDSWAALIRKFDTVSVTTLDMLTDDEILKKLIRKLINTRKSIAITGETASGKTTWLRALLIENGKNQSIRVIESESFELNLREYLPESNVLTLRMSDNDKASGVLGFSKKTTGQVFVVGEVNTPDMAVMLTDMAHTAECIFFTAHYTETVDMVSDFTNALLNYGGYSDEKSARREAISALGIDIHLRRKNGKRYIERISEVMSDGNIRCIFGIPKEA